MMPEFERPEFQRMVRARPTPPDRLAIEADAGERAALARRFGIAGIDTLRAEAAFVPEKETVAANGRLRADLVQTCAVSGDDFPVHIDEPLNLRFVQHARVVAEDEEAELPADEPDEIEFSGDSFDFGEAVAQTLGLAIDPYAEGPNAEETRRAAGLADENTASGPMAELLKGLKLD